MLPVQYFVSGDVFRIRDIFRRTRNLLRIMHFSPVAALKMTKICIFLAFFVFSLPVLILVIYISLQDNKRLGSHKTVFLIFLLVDVRIRIPVPYGSGFVQINEDPDP
jgi:hypothetical protein